MAWMDNVIDKMTDSLAYLASLAGSVNPNGAVDVNIQDQITRTLIAKFNKPSAATTVASETAIDDTVLTVVDSSIFSVGSYLIVFSPLTKRYFVSYVLSITGDDLSLDTPIDSVFSIGDTVAASSTAMNVNGSITPQIFGIRGVEMGSPVDIDFDITRIIFNCETDGIVDLSKFGDIAGGLIKGLVLRRRDGEYNNIFNIKTNADMAGIMYDFTVEQASNPVQGQNGFYSRLTFASPGKIGVVIRIAADEDLEFIVQDDLSSLLKFEVVAEGHEVD